MTTPQKKPTVSDMITQILATYDCIRQVAYQCTGNEVRNLARTSEANWIAVHQSTLAMHKKWAYGLRCDGSGLVRWGGQEKRIWLPYGPFYQCLDDLFEVPRAKPCDSCGTAVCNICRFHVDRDTRFLWGWTQDTPFDDGSPNRRLDRTEWRRVGWSYNRFIWEEDEPPNPGPKHAETIVAGLWRVYCKKHMEAKKTELRFRLKSANSHLPGPLCSCDPIDEMVRKRWLCISCVQREYGELPLCEDVGEFCGVEECGRKSVKGWKQCGFCGLLMEPCVVKGFNAVHRSQ